MHVMTSTCTQVTSWFSSSGRTPLERHSRTLQHTRMGSYIRDTAGGGGGGVDNAGRSMQGSMHGGRPSGAVVSSANAVAGLDGGGVDRGGDRGGGFVSGPQATTLPSRPQPYPSAPPGRTHHADPIMEEVRNAKFSLKLTIGAGCACGFHVGGRVDEAPQGDPSAPDVPHWEYFLGDRWVGHKKVTSACRTNRREVVTQSSYMLA